ncbi:MAG TPA: polyphosphate kinase 1, partial [Chloroflexota bacterium]|nr:polyphosphate kinase 1 [Chloroflexota bacterium]
ADLPEAIIAAQPETREIVRPEAFFSRELSWIDFNWRVLNETCNPRHPLLERVKFLAISDSNLDEFFMVRISGLLGEVDAGVSTRTPDGRTPAEELAEVREATRRMMAEQRRLLQESLLPALADAGIVIVPYDDLPRARRQELDAYFEREIFPVCTPLAIDPAQSFPFISNLSLNLLVVLRSPEGVRHLARVKVPPFRRLIPLNGRSGRTKKFVWLEDLVCRHLDSLFPELHIEEVYPFRVLRDADFEVREIEAGDLLEKVRAGLQMRRFGEAVALQVDQHMPRNLRELLTRHLDLDAEDEYPVSGRLGLADLMLLHELDVPDLKDQPFVPRIPQPLTTARDIFSAIRQGDIMLHHPFDSFDPIIELLNEAAADPTVLAIKQTLYRVGLNSPIVEALRTAVDRGKQVAVLLELKARFDEENNIGWAEELERAGVHVMYGFAGLKTHCKVALIVRREADGIRRYVHIGTGNYNRVTARLYTDIGLLTCREEIAADASDLFNFLTGYSRQTRYQALLVAPVNLREGLRARIERESEQQAQHGNGRLIFKMNQLTDPQLIESLYVASQAGVQVDLLIRGICCLRPGVPNLSDNIRVFSFLGRFLEHSRVFYFQNGGNEEVLIGSADVMQRNLDYRVEALVPIFDAAISRQLKDILDSYLADTLQTYELHADGRYERREPGDAQVDAQHKLLEIAQSSADLVPRRFAQAVLSGGH